MAMNTRRNPLAALLDYATARGDEASSIGNVMSQLAKPILVAQGVQPDETSPRPPPRPVNLTGGGVPVPPLPKTTSDAQEYYIREMQKRGMSRPVSEGIVAGMGSESGLDPTINERNPTVPGSRGGFGLYQLTGPRRIAFERWASENNKNINKPEDQLDFMMTEFAGPERKAYDALIQSPDAQSAAKTFTEQFLRPGASHSAQSVNEAARMSGQPFDPSLASSGMNTGISTMGGPQTTGGALPQTVEGILSTLYPDSSEAEKKAHRKDIFMGLSQGLSALSQGRPVDLSNIAANADQRRRQNVVDMRDRDRARAGAALIYSQTGDADMAGAVASGVMSINDVFSERERKRLTEQADAQRLKTEQANKALGGLVLGMSKDFGFDEKRTAEVAAALDAGADPSTVLTLGQQSKLADEARKKEDESAAAAEKRAAVAEEYATSEDPLLRLTGQLLLSDPNMTVAEGYKLAADRFPVAKEGGDKGFEFQAQIDARMANLGEDKATATRAVLDAAQKAGATNLTIGPDGTITVMQGAGGAPAAGGVPVTTGEAGVTDLGTTAPGTVTAMTPTGELINAPIPGAMQPAQAAADLAATEQATATAAEAAPTELAIKKTALATDRQQLEQTIAQEQDVNKKVAAEAQLADLKVQEAQLAIDELKASAPTDAEKAKVDLANAQANLESASLDNEKKHRELADAETGKAASLAKSLARADTGASVTTSTVSDILKATADWEAGMLGGIQRAGAALIPGSDTYNVESVLIPQLDANSIISNITAMKAASPSGATGFGATTAPELDALRDLLGKLDVKGDPALLRQNARVLNNYVLDSAYGTVEQIKANDKLTDAEKEFYGQRYDVKSGEIKYLGIKPIDEGVITMWDSPPAEIDASQRSPEEQALIDKANAIAAANAASGGIK